MRIGVFDSGIGGEAIASALQAQFPEAELVVVNDKAHVPYGGRPQQEIIQLTTAALQPLLSRHCDIIIIACNTATTAAIQTLRTNYPDQFFIGIEPMIKTAAQKTKSKLVTVCATPATLQSVRYAELKERFGEGITFIEPDCSDWARLIEANALSRSEINAIVGDSLRQNSDVIVLGCTHYHWIKEVVEEAAGSSAIILEPSEAIGRRVKELLRL